MEIDASSAYLPENTWFVEGQYHGQYFYEEYTRSLVTKLLFTDEIKDVHSSPDYPQFEYSDNPHKSIHAKFNSSPSGYLGKEDSKLVIRNLSDENHIKILAVTPYGIDLDFDISGIGMLEPGEEAELSFSGNLPEKTTAAQITVSYAEFGSVSLFNISDFSVTVVNGESTESGERFTSSEIKTNLEKALPESLFRLISKLSLRQTAECIYNAVKEII